MVYGTNETRRVREEGEERWVGDERESAVKDAGRVGTGEEGGGGGGEGDAISGKTERDETRPLLTYPRPLLTTPSWADPRSTLHSALGRTLSWSAPRLPSRPTLPTLLLPPVSGLNPSTARLLPRRG